MIFSEGMFCWFFVMTRNQVVCSSFTITREKMPAEEKTLKLWDCFFFSPGAYRLTSLISWFSFSLLCEMFQQCLLLRGQMHDMVLT